MQNMSPGLIELKKLSKITYDLKKKTHGLFECCLCLYVLQKYGAGKANSLCYIIYTSS